MSFIRPEARATLHRFREALIGAAILLLGPVSYTHLTLPTIYSV